MSMRLRFVILIGGTILLLVAWFALAFRPASSKLAEVKLAVATTREEVAALEARLATLQALKADEKSLRAQAAKFEKALPDDPAVTTYIRQVEKIAEQAGIDWVSTSPSLPSAPVGGAPPPPPPPSSGAAGPAPAPSPSTAEPAAPTGAAAAAAPVPVPALRRTISVSIAAGGTFFNLQSFVSKLERLERAIRIDDFSLSGGGDAGEAGSPSLSLSLKLQMYMGGAPPAPEPGGTASDAPEAVDRFTGGATQGVD